MPSDPSVFEQTLTLELSALQPEVRVLIVDDDPEARDYLVTVVQEAGYETAVAASGEEALKLLDHEFCPIMITDRNMPGMDGVTLCKRAREGQYPGYLYIFLLTAQNGDADIVSGLKAGADDYLGKKNISTPELIARLGNARRIVGLEQALRRALDQKRQMANTDVLTGAYSRRYLERQLSLELERTRRFNHPVSVLLLDIDYFKRINDRFGHAVGDEVLRSAYRRLRDLLPRACDWIGRYGGEEFLVVLIDTDLRGAEIVAHRLVAGLAESPIETSVGTIPVTISIGGAEAAQMLTSDLSFKGLLEIADHCLYASKRDGRNRYTLCLDSDSPLALSSISSHAHAEARHQ
ncbi:diguanylate cyclase [Peristeroidobacter soli]|jgi:two-component system chemotaxis response regulator CheY|uniref:diguanylate cyclase n=1 Tax=Peristeroidobacter soli TaxID=2497877 RepID=UPI00101D4AB9|nr:diguanylate cyclase [Peristeroidobacter soli]